VNTIALADIAFRHPYLAIYALVQCSGSSLAARSPISPSPVGRIGSFDDGRASGCSNNAGHVPQTHQHVLYSADLLMLCAGGYSTLAASHAATREWVRSRALFHTLRMTGGAGGRALSSCSVCAACAKHSLVSLMRARGAAMRARG
jgi:hypothetical protein